MRFLITTQKLDKNDDVLGFFNTWIEEFAIHCERVTVICLEQGEHSLPKNVKVFSLGKVSQQISKAKGQQLFRKIKYSFIFLGYIWKERKNYDAVFVHMNPEYVLLGGFLWRLLGKRIGMWYVHRNVDLKLRIAEKLVHAVFSSSKEAFRLKSTKVYFLGHGLPVASFACVSKEEKRAPQQISKQLFRITHVGRITPIKNLNVLIETARILKKKFHFHITFAGGPSTEGDNEYLKTLKNLVKIYALEEQVTFLGGVSHREIKKIYCNSDLTVNLTPTGGMDKAVLESIATKTLVLTSNRAFENIFGLYSESLIFKDGDVGDLAKKIMDIHTQHGDERKKVKEYLFEKIKNNFDVEVTIPRILSILQY